MSPTPAPRPPDWLGYVLILLALAALVLAAGCQSSRQVRPAGLVYAMHQQRSRQRHVRLHHVRQRELPRVRRAWRTRED